MADFNTSWNITRSYEGQWTDYNDRLTDKSDGGNYYPFGKKKPTNYVGTNFGFTAAFADNYLQGWQKMTPAAMYQKMKSLPESQVKNSFGFTKWQWCRCSDIQNQNIANLLFDFTIMADQEMVKAVAKALKLSVSKISQVKKITTRKTTDGYRVLNDNAVTLINNHRNPQEFFNLVKNGYAAYHNRKNSPAAIKKRVASFKYIHKTGLRESQNIFDTEGVQILYFTSAGCAPCIETKPKVKAIAAKYNATFNEIDVRTEGGKQSTINFGFYGFPIPICVILRDGKIVSTMNGKADILNNIEKHFTTNKPDGFKKMAWGISALFVLAMIKK